MLETGSFSVTLSFQTILKEIDEMRDNLPSIQTSSLFTWYSKTCVKWPLSKISKIGFQEQLSLHAGQKYCRMLQLKHSAILSTFIKLPFFNIYILSIVALDETNISSCLYFSMQNIEMSFDLELASRQSNVNVSQ